MPQPASPPVRRTRIPAGLLVVLVAVSAIVLRLLAMSGDFWLDEIWSWLLVRDAVKRPLDILFAIRHDNNHLLNSWWIYLLGPDVDWRWYRLPSALLGSGVVLLSRRAVRQDGPQAERAATLLTLLSYLLIHYSSEARGYAGLLFCVAASYVLLQRLLPPAGGTTSDSRASCGQGWLGVCLFWGSAVCGCLSHATFYYALAAFGVWSCYRFLFARIGWVSKVGSLLALFALPALLAGLLWLASYSQLQIGGGDIENPWLVGASTASLLLGGPFAGEGILLGALLLLLATGCEMVRLIRLRDDRWVLWLAMIVMPAMLIAFVGHEVVYPRYFLPTVLCLQLALASLLGTLLARGGWRRIVPCAALAAMTLGNVLHLARLYRDGRGHPAAIVRWLADHTAGDRILVGSDNPFRHGMVLAYYLRELPPDKRLLHFGTGPWPPGGPEWLLVHSQELDWTPDAELQVSGSVRFRLENVDRYAGLSGWHTAIYHNEAFAEDSRAGDR